MTLLEDRVDNLICFSLWEIQIVINFLSLNGFKRCFNIIETRILLNKSFFLAENQPNCTRHRILSSQEPPPLAFLWCGFHTRHAHCLLWAKGHLCLGPVVYPSTPFKLGNISHNVLQQPLKSFANKCTSGTNFRVLPLAPTTLLPVYLSGRKCNVTFSLFWISAPLGSRCRASMETLQRQFVRECCCTPRKTSARYVA